MILTGKQISIMKVVTDGNENGSDVDMDQVLSRVDYKTTKESMQFSIRALRLRGLLQKSGTENRRNRRRVLFAPTIRGTETFNRSYKPPSTEPHFNTEAVESEVVDLLDDLFDELL
jgi:hypothetical protein